MARRLVVPILTLVSLVVVIKLFVNSPVGERCVAATAAGAVLFEIFDWVNWKRALLLGKKGLWRLLGAYFFWFLVTVAVAVVGFLVTPGSWQGLVVVVVFVLVAFRRAVVEEAICRELAKSGAELPEPIWGKSFATWVDAQIGTYANRKVDDGTPVVDVFKRALVRWIRGLPISPHHDGRRAVAVLVIAAAVLFGGWVGVVWAKRSVHEVKIGLAIINPFGSSGNSKPGSWDTPYNTPKMAVETGRSHSGVTPVAPEALTNRRLTNECPTPLITGGPRWARAAIVELYLGGDGRAAAEAPGTSVAGCPGKLHVTHTSAGLFAYTVGASPATSAALSVAVDSPMGAALFLAPAVKPVLALIHRFKVIGGIHRYGASGGDFYPVQTPIGTYVLIRRETGTDQAAEPYTVVPPIAAQAWVMAMAKAQAFLWPVPRDENGETIYDFDSNSVPSRVAYTFPYHPPSRPEPELGEEELEKSAALAG